MKAEPDDLTVRDVLDLKSQQMLVVNPEYQRGVVWTRTQQKKLVDSVLRGYPIPLIYFHHIQQTAAGLRSERFEVIDGQQRITALHEFHEGAFKLFDPVKDAADACKFSVNLRHLFSAGIRHLLGHRLRESQSRSRRERECYHPWREARSSS